MLKNLLAAMAMLFAMSTFAGVDVNKASAAELDGIRGIGPSTSNKILDERKKGNFKDWQDFIDRTKGVSDANAAKFSAEGLTVNGATFTGATAAKAKQAASPATPASSAKK
jgi:competence protein ComEA